MKRKIIRIEIINMIINAVYTEVNIKNGVMSKITVIIYASPVYHAAVFGLR